MKYYRALDMLTDQYPPLLYGQLPYWRPKAPDITADVHVPAWDWTHPDLAPGADLVTLDVCGSWLSAASSAQYAHGALVNTGTGGEGPGFYLTDAHVWQEKGIVSPLGDNPISTSRVWVTYPTLHLLRGLAALDHAPWPDVTVYNSWTCPPRTVGGKEKGTTFRLRKWVEAVQGDRVAALERLALDPDDPSARARYKLIKDGYSIAIEMLAGAKEGGDVKGSVRRPDWTLTTQGQHAASTWRKAYNSLLAGHGPVYMGVVDEITYLREDYEALLTRDVPVFRMDETGVKLGALRKKVQRA